VNNPYPLKELSHNVRREHDSISGQKLVNLSTVQCPGF